MTGDGVTAFAHIPADRADAIILSVWRSAYVDVIGAVNAAICGALLPRSFSANQNAQMATNESTNTSPQKTNGFMGSFPAALALFRSRSR